MPRLVASPLTFARFLWHQCVQDRSTSESKHWACITPEVDGNNDCYITYGVTDAEDEFLAISKILVGEVCSWLFVPVSRTKGFDPSSSTVLSSTTC